MSVETFYLLSIIIGVVDLCIEITKAVWSTTKDEKNDRQHQLVDDHRFKQIKHAA